MIMRTNVSVEIVISVGGINFGSSLAFRAFLQFSSEKCLFISEAGFKSDIVNCALLDAVDQL